MKNPFKRKKDNIKKITKKEKNSNKKTKKKDKKLKDKHKYKVIGGILGDKDTRTKKSLRWLLFWILCFAGLVLGIVLFINGKSNMNYEIENNTTPIGTKEEFSKSGADVTIKDVWTDKNRDLLVVKLGYNDSARKKLPIDGDNYHLTLLSNKGKRPDITGSYGILGTEGDGYLFLKGDIKEEAYQIVIANQVQLSTGGKAGDETGSSERELDEASMDKALSEASFEKSDSKGHMFSNLGGKDGEPRFDNIDFRVNGFSDSTNVYKGTFLKEDGSIDYGKVVGKTSIDAAIKKADKKVKKRESEVKLYERSVKDFESRVKKNKKDKEAKKNLEKSKKSLEDAKENLETAKKTKEQWKNLDYDKSDFGDMQEELKFKTIK